MTSFTKSHFFFPPAIPTVLQPKSFAICPTTEPTAPEAADTTTVSLSLTFPTSLSPKYAVLPGIPAGPKKDCIGARSG